ncbi:hypothetical protein RB653_007139 [Dictyostelium firmibasis]|uniref:Protein kinase domain-containing protein n=1 Tax=Dictyostelium firmibasis TaxID=79012 RepID=A0AAN7U392_9MYCE
MINKISRFKILFLLLLIVISLTYAQEDDVITTPEGYYNLKRFKRFPHYKNIQPNEEAGDTDLYYPNVCESALRSDDRFSFFILKAFPGAVTGYNSLFITKTTSMTMDASSLISAPRGIFTLCIEGNLTVDGGKDSFYVAAHAVVVLPGGTLTMKSGQLSFYSISEIPFIDLVTIKNLTDPFYFFPGLLVLGGNFKLAAGQRIIYSAKRLSDTSLKISPPFLNSKYSADLYRVRVFTDSKPQGFYCNFGLDSSGTIMTISLSYYNNCLPLLETDKIIKLVILLKTFNDGGKFTNSINTLLNVSKHSNKKETSIFITGDSNVYMENYQIENLGGTKNDPYNDTKLIFSPDDRNTVTDIIMGKNQRFRSSLYIEFSNNVIIKNSLIAESSSGTRSPMVFFASNVYLSGNIISSNSGSSLIAQYGTENIKSSSNFYIQGALNQPTTQNINLIEMDYGNEGNGIYSTSPNIYSSDDTFIGQVYSINFNFITNRSMITGFDQDCYAPCLNNSIPISNNIQYPVDFNIFNPKFFPTNNTNGDWYVLKINDNGNQPGTYYTVKNLTTSDSVTFSLENSVLSFVNLETSENFRMNGNVKRLDIVNSNIGSPSITNQQQIISGVSSSAISIRNSYVYSRFDQQITPADYQIYGSLITPFYYNDSDIINHFKILSIFPDVPYQIVSGSILNVSVNLQMFTDTDVSCVFTNNDTFNSTVSLVDGSCILPYIGEKEGFINLKVTLKTSTSNDYLYTIDFPKITVYNEYFFYSGWAMIDSNLNKDEISIDGNRFKTSCQQVSSGNCTISTNSKYVTGLPNVTTSQQLNTLFSKGITSINSYEPTTITVHIDKESINNQIQMYFTHQPIDMEKSPLSIYVENQPIFLLEPLQSNLDPSFKNLTFNYDNSKSLEKINISFTTRGDIYLTSLAIYSSYIPLFISSTPTPTSTPSTPTQTTTKNYKLKITLPICLFALLLAVLILICIVFRRKKQSKQKWVNIEHGNELPSIEVKRDCYESYDKIKELKVFKPEDFKKDSYPNETITYGISDSLKNFVGSDLLDYNDPNLPLSFNKVVLEFGLSGAKCEINSSLSDSLVITNKSGIKLSIVPILPNNDSGEVKVSFDSFELDPGASIELMISLKLICTTRFFERFAIEARHIDSFESIHTHLFIHVESNISPRLDAKEIEVKELISNHYFSTINLANYRGLQVAVRKIKINDPIYSKETIQIIKKFYLEMDTLSKLKNKNIISFIGCTNDASHLWIVMEYAPLGSLGSLINEKKENFSLIQKVKLLLDTARGYEFLHSNDIIRCNIKPNNLLVFSRMEKDDVCVKISDFGFKEFIQQKVDSKEMFKEEKNQKVVDVHTFGITIYEILTETPFKDIELENIPSFFMGDKRLPLEKLDSDIRNIIERCWDQNKSQRPTFSEISILLKEKYTKLLGQRNN